MIMINHLFQWEWLSGWQNVPAYACNMSRRWNQYRPSRTCLYLCTSDIWICWFGRIAFVKPSRQVISTLPLERRWISPKKSWIFQIQSSAFAVRWFIHICQSLLFSSLLINRNSFVQPIRSFTAKTIVDHCTWGWENCWKTIDVNGPSLG